MSRTVAWTLANAGFEARHAAEVAAQRAGKSLEDWLNEAIVEYATVENDGEGSGPDHLDRDRDGVQPQRWRRRWGSQTNGGPRRDAVSGFETTIDGIERSGSVNEQMLERPKHYGERHSPTEVSSGGDLVHVTANRREERTGGNRAQGFAGQPHGRQRPEPPDLRKAVSQITLRRQHLNSRETSVPTAQEQSDAQARRRRPDEPSAAAGDDVARVVEKPDARRQQAEQLLAVIDALATKLSATLTDPDPKPAAEGLEREVRAIGGKINRLAEAAINPGTLEYMRKQTEEIVRVLAAAVSRRPPLERIERQISDLADRVERIGARPPPDNSIRQRREPIDERLDQEVDLASNATVGTQQFEDLARRIDGALPSAKPVPHSRLDAPRLDALLEELCAKLERQEHERCALEPLLTQIIERLDRLQHKDALASAFESGPVEHILRSLTAKIERASKFDIKIIDEIVEKVAHSLKGQIDGRTDTEYLAEQIATIQRRLEAVSAEFEASAQKAICQLVSKLQGSLVSPGGPRAQPPADVRVEGADADRRTRFSDIRSALERLTARRSTNGGALGDDGPDEPDPDGARLRREPTVEPSPEEDRLPLPHEAGPDFLLEPGAETRAAPQEAPELAKAIGSRPGPTVSAHIAAARRAAQSPTVAERVVARPSPPVAPIALAAITADHAKALYASNKTSPLLALAAAAVVALAVQSVGVHLPLTQDSEKARRPARPHTRLAESLDLPGGVQPASRPLDLTPTGSIRPSAEPENAGSVDKQVPPVVIPSGLPQRLSDAVSEGLPGAEYELASRLLEGRGIPQDERAAVRWFERAAASGFAPAQFKVAVLYERGTGTPRDPAVAKSWYLKSAEAGNARAAHNLAIMYAEPVGEKPDYAEAAKWFRKAGELGVRDSQFNLAVLYARGLGVEQDLRRSWLWFSLAAAQGDADATKKRDEVAERMDPNSQASAADELAKFKLTKPDPIANDVAIPSGGWDVKPIVQP